MGNCKNENGMGKVIICIGLALMLPVLVSATPLLLEMVKHETVTATVLSKSATQAEDPEKTFRVVDEQNAESIRWDYTVTVLRSDGEQATYSVANSSFRDTPAKEIYDSLVEGGSYEFEIRGKEGSLLWCDWHASIHEVKGIG